MKLIPQFIDSPYHPSQSLDFIFPMHEFDWETENPRRERRGVPERTLRTLEPGDHIYTWRGASTETHHGIYMGYEKVIHFKCRYQPNLHGVLSSSLDQFLSGGDLHFFEYNVNPAFFLAKPGQNTRTIASADPRQVVLHRAFFLLNNSSVDYHPYIKNCYDFAIYCKTGLVTNVTRNEPAAYTLAITAFMFLVLLQRMPVSFTALAAAVLGIDSTCRLALDVGARPDMIKVEVDRFDEAERLASRCLGFQRTIQFFGKVALVALICAFTSLAFSMWCYRARLLIWCTAVIKFLLWPFFNRTFKIRCILSNKVQKKKLRCGDHIYTWRRGYSYAHHGIYVGKRKVIHLTRREGPIVSSSSQAHNLGRVNGGGDYQPKGGGAEMCSIDTFLDGGEIYLYDYGVDLGFFIAKSRGGTCTLAYSDPPALVLHRASLLLDNRFGDYNLFYNNCEDFAIYCKTGLLARKVISIGRSGQTTSYAALVCALIPFPYRLLTSNFIGVVAVAYVLYSIWRVFSDTGYRRDAHKVAVKELAAFEKFIALMFRQLLFTLVPKFLCSAILLRTFLFPRAAWTIHSQNCLLDWIITVGFFWAAFF